MTTSAYFDTSHNPEGMAKAQPLRQPIFLEEMEETLGESLDNWSPPVR